MFPYFASPILVHDVHYRGRSFSRSCGSPPERPKQRHAKSSTIKDDIRTPRRVLLSLRVSTSNYPSNEKSIPHRLSLFVRCTPCPNTMEDIAGLETPVFSICQRPSYRRKSQLADTETSFISVHRIHFILILISVIIISSDLSPHAPPLPEMQPYLALLAASNALCLHPALPAPPRRIPR